MEKSKLHSDESKENNTRKNMKLDRKRRCAQLLKCEQKIEQPPPPPPPPSPFNLAESELPPPPPPLPPIESSDDNLTDHQNRTTYSTNNNSNETQVAEDMEIDSNNLETQILTQNPLPAALAKGSFFTFDIDGFEEAAQRMARKKNEQSSEERLAFIIGSRVEYEQISRKKELEKRLNRTEVISRNELLKRMLNNETIQTTQVSPAIEYQKQLNANAHPNIEATDNNQEQMMNKADEQIQWSTLQSIDDIPVPFSWKTYVENWRANLAADEASSSKIMDSSAAEEISTKFINQLRETTNELAFENGLPEKAQSQQNESVNVDIEQSGTVELDGGGERMNCHIKTPPPLKKKKRKSNVSKAKKNLTTELLIVLDDDCSPKN